NTCMVLISKYIFFFFFSSRRRHTRFSRDWSSDVCSSDLMEGAQVPGAGGRGARNRAAVAEKQGKYAVEMNGGDVWKTIEALEKQMFQAAKDLEFEAAAKLRDQIEKLKEKAIAL